MMNGSEPHGPSGGCRAPSLKHRRPRLRVSCSPSPRPSPRYVFSAMVGMARCAVPDREVAVGTNIQAPLAFEEVAPLHAARTSQRDVPTTLNTYSPRGEGETFARCFITRPSLAVVYLRSDRQKGGDCNRHIRIFQRCASALPLLGERAGVRGNEANSNSRHTTTPRTDKLSKFHGRYVFSVAQVCNLPYRRIAFCGMWESSRALELSDPLPITNRRYGRLQICATDQCCALNTYPGRAGGFPIWL
jgi:hypothetical protein